MADRAALEARVQAWLAAREGEYCLSHPYGMRFYEWLGPRVLALAERCARLGVEGEWFTVGGDPNVPVDAEAMVAEVVARALAEDQT